MTFYDKNGAALAIGDHIVPDEGRELVLEREETLEDTGEAVLIGRQVLDNRLFSLLTQENLSLQWTKTEG